MVMSFSLKAQVWPGDANNNGIVNNVDFIFTGLAIETGGSSRLAMDQGISWSEKPANDWTNSFTSFGVNYKHADADGDGWIDGTDMYSINDYYDTTNVNFTTKMGNIILGDDLFISFTDTIVEVGDTIRLKINLGTPTNPINNLHGVAFSINLDTSKIKEEETVINFHAGWLGTPGTDLYAYDKYNPAINPTRADFAATRGFSSAISGSGEIGELIVIIEDDLIGKRNDIITSIGFSFENVIGIDSFGVDMNISSKNNVVSVSDGKISSNVNISKKLEIELYPNPSSEIVYFNTTENIKKVELTELSGKRIETTFENNQINVSKINSGIYFLLIETEEKNRIIKKLIIK